MLVPSVHLISILFNNYVYITCRRYRARDSILSLYRLLPGTVFVELQVSPYGDTSFVPVCPVFLV